MTKAEILRELGLEELAGTGFEGIMEIVELKKGESVYCDNAGKLFAQYLVEGRMQYIIYTPEGGEFYINVFPGEIRGVNRCFFRIVEDEFIGNFEADLLAKEDSVIAKLPLGKIFEMEFPQKEKLLQKIIEIIVRENFKHSRYLFFKNIYSDEEFLIKILEKYDHVKVTTKELAELLNINLRTLQRLVKNLDDAGIISRENKTISIIDQEKLAEYKTKFEK